LTVAVHLQATAPVLVSPDVGATAKSMTGLGSEVAPLGAHGRERIDANTLKG
jgi:hypothetical protein